MIQAMAPAASKSHFRYIFGCAIGLLLLAGVATASFADKTVLTVGIPWSDPVHSFGGVFSELKKAYEKSNPNVEIMYLAGFDTEKTITAWAGGVLPDIVFGWGNSPQMREVFHPLDDLMAKHDVLLDDYLPGSVGQMHNNDQTWTLQVFIDPNFPLIYNKTMFNEAGLNPDEPPATVAEFDALFPKLTRTGVDGAIEQIAMPPWMWAFDREFTNALTFGSAFGAQLWDGTETEGRLGTTSPQMVRAYDWIKQYFDLYGDAAAALVHESFGHVQGRMTAGTQAMYLWTTQELDLLRQNAPHFEWAVAPPFHEENEGIPNPIWFGGWAAGVSSQSAYKDEAFQYLAFMSHAPEGQTILARVGELFPATKQSPGFAELVERDPVWYNFIPAIQQSTLSPPSYWLAIPWEQAFAQVSVRIFREGIAPVDALTEAEHFLRRHAEEFGVTIH